MVRPSLSRRVFPSIVFTQLLFAGVAPVLAQDIAADAQAPAHISVVDGVAILERDGRTDDSPGNMPLLAGDRVRTRDGRVEILFADGSTLHLDRHSAIDLQSDELIRLLEGRIRLTIPGPARDIAYRVDGPQGWAHITEPGEYRMALINGPRGSELELAVVRGRAELANEGGQTPLRAGERAFVQAGAAPSYAYVANSAAFDAFDRWSEARRDERMSASAAYLPDEVQPYAAAFERHGYWRTEPTYGRVWYPRVSPGWRPYYRGRWVSLRPFGWTWVAQDPWGWPTHHYGRWGYSSAGAWFWMPGRRWGAAWVSWAHAPGYVSWCPLGWDNRPVLQIGFGIRAGYDPWRAWTVIPDRHFGGGSVDRYVVRAGSFDRRTHDAFTIRDRAPEVRGYAVPRGSTPIRVAGSASARRATAPLYTNLPAGEGRMRTDGARVRVPDAVAPSSAGRAAQGRAASERTVPDRPVVRSAPSIDDGRRPAVPRQQDSPATETWRAGRRSDAPRPGAPRPEVPGYGLPRSADRSPESRGSAAPRYDVPGARPPAYGESSGDRDAAVPRGGIATPPAPPRADAPPSYRRPAEGPPARPSYRADSPGPSPEGSRAIPRGEGGRPSGAAAAPPGGAARPAPPSRPARGRGGR